MQISEALPGRFYQEYADFTKGKLYLSLRDEITLSRYRMHARNEMEEPLLARISWIESDNKFKLKDRKM